MKVMVLILSALFFYGGTTVTDVAKQKLNGKVRSVVNCQCPVQKNGKVDSLGCIIYVFRYDDKGNQVEDNDYYQGNLKDGYGKLNTKRIYRYDAEGRQVGADEYKPDGTLSQKVEYKYDSAGNRIERANYTPDGKLWARSVFAYDDKGNKTECSKYNNENMLLEHYTYTYDSKGFLVLEQHVNIRPKKPGDKNDEQVAMRMMDYVKTYVYDDSGRMIRETDNLATFKFPFETGFQYQNYDAEGNWLKQVNTEGGKTVSITERVIDYYKF